MRRLALALISFLALLIAVQSSPNQAALLSRGGVVVTQQTAYYVSPTGNDGNAGTQASPWLTTTKVNGFVFPKNSTINFDGGNGAFTGCLNFTLTNIPTTGVVVKPYNGSTFELDANCTGSNSNGIVIDSLTSFTLQDFVLKGNSGGVWNGVEVTNSTGITSRHITVQRGNVSGFYVTSSPTQPGSEILVTNLSFGIIDDINILNNTLGGSSPTSPDESGIGGFAYVNTAPVTNVTYSGNTVQNLGGKSTWYQIGITPGGVNGATVTGNIVHDIGANSTTCGGPGGIVTFNANAVDIKLNEVYNVQPVSYTTGCDWVGIDLDGGTTNSTVEYNYVHHIAGNGLYMYANFAAIGGWGPNVVRYNIDENDGTLTNNATEGSITFSGEGANPAIVQVYGNTVYLSNPGGASPAGGTIQNTCFTINSFSSPVTVPSAGSYFYDNLCVMAPDASGNLNFIAGIPGVTSTNMLFSANQYYGLSAGTFRAYRFNGSTYTSFASWQAAAPGSEVGSITTNPTLVSAGGNVICGGTASPSCPAGYKLSNGSPSFGAGFRPDLPPFNQTTPQDYFADALPPGTNKAASIGAFYGVPTSDSTAPTVAITSPSGGATITTPTTLTATCSDNVACQSVQFKVDGAAINTAVLNTGGTYSTLWTIASVANGAHTLTAVGQDTSGNTTTSAGVSITVTAANQFYVSGAGNDSWNGASPTHTSGSIGPWLSPTPVNAASFPSGTTISFDRANGAITGCMLLSAQTNAPGGNITVNTYGTGSGNAVINSNCAGSNTGPGGIYGPKTNVVLVDGIGNFVWNGVDVSGAGTATQWCLTVQNSTGAIISNVTIENSNLAGCFTTATQDGGVELVISGLSQFGLVQYPSIPDVCGEIDNITITGNTMHGLNGAVNSHDAAGIGTFICGPPNAGSHAYNLYNLTITSNQIYDIGGLPGGTYFLSEGNGAVIAGDTVYAAFNLVHDIGANNRLCGGGSGLWTAQETNGLFQFNEVYNVRYVGSTSGSSPCDSSGLGMDGHTTNTVFEYNYSHDNSGGGIYTCAGTCAYGGNGPTVWANNTIRYNIFQNNATFGSGNYGEIALGGSGASGPIYVYNNSMFNNDTFTGFSFASCVSPNGVTFAAGSLFANNLCDLNTVNAFGQTTFYADNSTGTAGLTILNNDWYNSGSGSSIWVWHGTPYSTLAAWAAASGGAINVTGSITTNPLLTSVPQVGACGGLANPPTCPAGYSVGGGSPVLGAGLDLTKTPYSLSVGAVNYYGSAIPSGGGTGYNMGAF